VFPSNKSAYQSSGAIFFLNKAYVFYFIISKIIIMSTKKFFIDCWREELPITVECLRRVPEDRWNWQPHPKTRSAKQLVDHIVCHAEDLAEGVKTGVIHHRLMEEYSSVDEAIQEFENHSAHLLELVAATSDEDWNHKMIPLVVFGNTAFERCMRDMCWSLFFDVIHHRGQLSIYYRPMGVPNPSIYGPTAEMMEARLAEMEGKN
jgi:uncharacterized damage-inducible protein DinB